MQTMVCCPDCHEKTRKKIFVDDRGNSFWTCEKCGTVHEDYMWYIIASEKMAGLKDNLSKINFEGYFMIPTGIEYIGIAIANGQNETDEFPDRIECMKWLASKQREGVESSEQVEMFEVYYLDVYPDECGWTENRRVFLGNLVVNPTGESIESGIMDAMLRFKYRDFRRQVRALTTKDPDKVYIEDCGEWFEIGEVDGRKPVYMILPAEGAI